jgi:uncharacterized protein (TIGR02147 family)
MEVSAQPIDFRFTLQEEFLKRVRRNSRYSIRAFAKSLEMDHSTLAKLLRGERPLGNRARQKLQAKLGLGPDETRETDYAQLSLDTFTLIADWHHYAILELMRLENFRPDLKWIARTLGIPHAEVAAAVQRLERCKLLKVRADGSWRDLTGGTSTTTGNAFTASAFRKLQRQLLERAIHCLEEIPMEKRDNTNMMMAVDSDRLPQAKERIKKFRRELARFLSRGKKRDQLYNLSLALFPLSEKE